MRHGELLKKFPLEPLKTFEKKDITTDGMFAKAPSVFLFARFVKLGFSGMFAQTLCVSFCPSFFKKGAGVGSAHEKRRFFLLTFSLRLLPAKKKWLWMLKSPVATAV